MDTVIRRGGLIVYLGMPIVSSPSDVPGLRPDQPDHLPAGQETAERGVSTSTPGSSSPIRRRAATPSTCRTRSGELVKVRANDGVHFEPAGGDIIARLVLKALNERYDLTSWRSRPSAAAASGGAGVPSDHAEGARADGGSAAMTTELDVTPAVAEVPPYLRAAPDVVAAMGTDESTGLSAAESAARLSRYGAEPDRGREATVGVGDRARAAARPDEHHARRRHDRELRDRRGLHRRSSSRFLIVLNVVLGSRQELKARASVDALVEPAGATGQGGARRHPRARGRGRRRARRHRAARGRRHRPGRRADPPLGHARDPGGGAHRRERADPEGRRRAARRRGRARRPVEHAVPEHGGHARYRGDGGDRHRHADADGSDRDDADVGHADPVTAAEGARLADEGARRHRLDARSRSSSSSASPAA